MKQTLQKTFVVTAMRAVTILLLAFLVVINLVNWYQVDRQTDRMLQTVLGSESVPQLPPPGPLGPQEPPIWRQVLPPEIQDDIQAEARHRVVSMLVLSTAGGVLCWLGMLALVVVLSRQSIRPVAESIQKQKEFVTNAGHELKTPLAIIQANTEAMELRQGESKWSRNIKEQTVRLNGLMENLLLLARMDETASPPPAEQVDLTDLAEESIRSFQEGASLRGILLEGALQPGVTVRSDRNQMAQLLSVLLDNGVKYTQTEGRILVTLGREGNRALLLVKNTPADLPEDPALLFDRFYRGDPARTQKTGGYGIGLSAARAIVESWQGTIQAGMEGEDTVVLTVSLPANS
ncbi:MAG: HAMP domain-containing histidine kinase [Ruminiclostridium sp.]|nr:HAMP domain-containing histidine kinase [Ruminiclostridium sp.]